jgi:hypothetical protein
MRVWGPQDQIWYTWFFHTFPWSKIQTQTFGGFLTILDPPCHPNLHLWLFPLCMHHWHPQTIANHDLTSSRHMFVELRAEFAMPSVSVTGTCRWGKSLSSWSGLGRLLKKNTPKNS